jgi:hypothetical protein
MGQRLTPKFDGSGSIPDGCPDTKRNPVEQTVALFQSTAGGKAMGGKASTRSPQ